jgi:hypothetical protein
MLSQLLSQCSDSADQIFAELLLEPLFLAICCYGFSAFSLVCEVPERRQVRNQVGCSNPFQLTPIKPDPAAFGAPIQVEVRLYRDSRPSKNSVPERAKTGPPVGIPIVGLYLSEVLGGIELRRINEVDPQTAAFGT